MKYWKELNQLACEEDVYEVQFYISPPSLDELNDEIQMLADTLAREITLELDRRISEELNFDLHHFDPVIEIGLEIAP